MDQQLNHAVDAYIDEVWDDVVADIAALVAHPSVADATKAAPDAPFGPAVRAALDEGLAVARRLGYETSDDEGYVGMCDIPGERAAQVATIAHVDVVPAGPGWDTDPFAVARREGWLLGRGVIDDKGPAVLALYAGGFFRHMNITPRYTYRALLGCDEEVGMTDVHHYLAQHEAPRFLFTPDASWPVCNAEKGCFDGLFRSPLSATSAFVSWQGAEATNAIPSHAELVLALPAAELPAPVAHAARISIEPAGTGRSRITAQGIGGHASLPAGTLNAIGIIVTYLGEVAAAMPDRFDDADRAALALLQRLHADTDGSALGIQTSSAAFGPLTLNAGTIAVADGHLVSSIDVRFPDSTTEASLTDACRDAAAAAGATFAVTLAKPPFSVAADSPAVQTLLAVYREVTGEEAEPFSMGGGTYARNFPCAVSFGPEEQDAVLPAWAGTMHGPNEAVCEASLRQALKIYILALVRLMELEL